jgi:hypothetical protein
VHSDVVGIVVVTEILRRSLDVWLQGLDIYSEVWELWVGDHLQLDL